MIEKKIQGLFMSLKSELYDKLNIWISSKILDLVAILPRFKGGIISRLQDIRNESQSEAISLLKKSINFQYDIEIDLLSFKMFEMFTIEDFDNIYSAITRIFSSLSENTKINLLIPLIKAVIEGDSDISSLIGEIYRDDKYMPSGFSFIKMKNLPDEVDFIKLYLSRVSSGIIILTAEVFINKSLINEIKDLRREKHISQIKFDNILKGNLNRNETGPEITLKRKISDHIDKLRFEIEKCLNDIFVGYFNSESVSKLYKQPIVEIYSLSKFPEMKTNDEISDYMNWLESYNVKISYNSFWNKKYIFNFNERNTFMDIKNRYSFSLILIEQEGTQLNTHELNKRIKLYDESIKLNSQLDFIIVSLSFIDNIKERLTIINKIIHNLEGKHTQKNSFIYKIISNALTYLFILFNKKNNINKYVKINSEIQKKITLLTIIENEFKKYDNKKTKINTNNLLSLENVLLNLRKINKKETVLSRFISMSSNQYKSIYEKLNYIKELLVNSITVLNIEVTYKLQRRAIYISIIAILLTEEFQSIIKKIIPIIINLFG